MLYIFDGLPGVGKTELSKYITQRIGAIYLRIDTAGKSPSESKHELMTLLGLSDLNT